MSSSDFAFNYFKQQGWSDYQAAAIVGNLLGESGLDTNVYGDNKNAYGIAQWHANRQAQFQKLYGRSIKGSSLEQQLGFVNWELLNTERNAGTRLLNSSNLSQATYAVMRGYERPLNDSSFGTRLKNATSVLGGKAAAKVKGGIDTTKAIVAGATVAFDVITGNPIGAATTAVSSLIPGLGGTSKSYLEQFQDWIANSHFFQRLAIVVLALILIVGALYIIGSKAANSA